MKEPTDNHELDRSLQESGLNSDGGTPDRETSRVVLEDPPAEPETAPEPEHETETAPVFPEIPKGSSNGETRDISLLEGVNVKVQVLLGRARLSVEEILKLGDGSVVELDRLAGEPLDILVNDRLVAQGEVLVLNDNFCIRVTDIIPPDERTQ
jgi:flagellar motor switch protein FliN